MSSESDPPGALCWQQFVNEVLFVMPRTGRWVYRGGLKSWEHRETSLERVRRAWNIPESDAPELERRLMREFRRHPQAKNGPEASDDLGWLALMQHHGAPTRLLDWTYSGFVAAYFAMKALFRKGGSLSGDSPKVWAINTDSLAERIEKQVTPRELGLYYDEKSLGSFGELFFNEHPKVFIGTVTPMIVNERLSVQQGVFLCPGDVTKSWEANLAAPARDAAPIQQREFLIRPSQLAATFEGLKRINITARSLFPGIDGYAESMAHEAEFLLQLPLHHKCTASNY